MSASVTMELLLTMILTLALKHVLEILLCTQIV